MVTERKSGSKKKMKKGIPEKRKTEKENDMVDPNLKLKPLSKEEGLKLMREFVESVEYQGKIGDWREVLKDEKDPDE